jgi:membrane protease YdiL (CAAX protease family)
LQPTPTQPVQSIPRSMQLALFVTGFLWLLASRSAAGHAAQGIANRLNLAAVQPPLQEAFFLFLLLVGFATLSWIATRLGGIRFTNALPRRSTAGNEWLTGAAIGWATLLASILPMVLAGDLHPQFWLAPRAWGLALLSILTLALGTLALEVAFRGYIYRCLIGAMGPTMATIFVSGAYALFSSFRPYATGFSVFLTFLAGILLSVAYLRTHALWLGWGLHFAWDASMGVLFGLPVAGLATYSYPVDTTVSGSTWLTGGFYGPEGALLTAVFLLAATVVLYRLTREYAWSYTHPPIIAAGYPMDIAPPVAHTAMETAAAARPAPLVQILSTTATTASTLPVIDEHLRSSANLDHSE